MGFSVVQGSPQTIWVPVAPGDTIYNGSIVTVDTASPQEGVLPLPVAAGASNTTNKDIPFGVVLSNNNIAGAGETSITEVAAGSIHGSTTKYQGVEGVWSKGDPRAMVEVALIDPSTVLRAPIYNAAYGTAPTVVTVQSGGGNTSGVAGTTDAADVATVAQFSTIYFRSGANMGAYRRLDSASDTTHTWDAAVKEDVAVGDTAVVINGLNTYGVSRMQIDAEARYVECSAALTSDYFIVNVLRLDLSTAGNEYVEFQFNADNFTAARA
jgi:hypothetical protein